MTTINKFPETPTEVCLTVQKVISDSLGIQIPLALINVIKIRPFRVVAVCDGRFVVKIAGPESDLALSANVLGMLGEMTPIPVQKVLASGGNDNHLP